LKKIQKNGVFVIETKGDERDNSDSAAKCRLGNQWAELAGQEFLYFMVFDKNTIDGTYTLDKAKEFIKQLLDGFVNLHILHLHNQLGRTQNSGWSTIRSIIFL